MPRPKIVVTNWVHPEVVEFLRAHGRVEANTTREPWSPEELAARAADADGLVTFMTDTVDGAFLARCPKLRVIACALKGADNFDVDACSRRGVTVTIVPDLLTAPTAELTVGLMISLARNILPGAAMVREGRFHGWRPTLYGRGLDGSAVGIVGMGAVGQALARRLRAFRCTLSYSDRRPLPSDQEDVLGLTRRSFEALVSRSDYLVLTLPLTPDSLHLVNADVISRMKPGTLLVNPARGSIVDEAAVVNALESGQLGGYAADVFEMEDWARGDRPRDVNPRLRAHPRTVLTPHLGSAVEIVRRDIAMSAAHDVVSVLAGERPATAINVPTEIRLLA